MTRDAAPVELIALADARAAARRRRDWATADALKVRIEEAGWKVVDTGSMYDLVRVSVPDIEVDGDVRYGSSTSVPSRLEEAPVGLATVVLVVTGEAQDLARSAGGLARHAPDGTRIVVVANDAAGAVATVASALDTTDPGAPGIVTEVVRTSGLGWAAALNAGVRRASTPLVVFLQPSVEPTGDLLSALVDALGDERVAVAGPFGLVSDDLRTFRAAAPDAVEVDAIDGSALAFRRSDYLDRGPLDERFTTEPSLDTWWSLVLRDVADDAEEGAVPRRAVQAGSDLVVRHPGVDRHDAATPEADRQARRNRYRFLKRFATRRDLIGRGGVGGGR